MAFKPFWDETLTDEVAEVTNGVLVAYRGDEFFMHLEAPSSEILTAMSASARGVAMILIGARSRFKPAPERGTLITVDGDDYLIGDYQNTEDGEDIIIALTRTTRTDF